MADVTIVVDVLNGFCKSGNLASPRCLKAVPAIRAVLEDRVQARDQLIFSPTRTTPTTVSSRFSPSIASGERPKPRWWTSCVPISQRAA